MRSNPVDMFLVEHVHIHQDGEEDVKTIGIYSTRAAAESAVQRALMRPGFRDAPDGFTIDLFRLDNSNSKFKIQNSGTGYETPN